MADSYDKTTDNPPTLLHYAEVIAWLYDQFREWLAYDYVVPVIPDHLKPAFDDAIQREALGRVAKAMQAAEDAALGDWS